LRSLTGEREAKFLLWNPETHTRFSPRFQRLVLTLLLAARRPEGSLVLSDETLFWVL